MLLMSSHCRRDSSSEEYNSRQNITMSDSPEEAPVSGFMLFSKMDWSIHNGLAVQIDNCSSKGRGFVSCKFKMLGTLHVILSNLDSPDLRRTILHPILKKARDVSLSPSAKLWDPRAVLHRLFLRMFLPVMRAPPSVPFVRSHQITFPPPPKLSTCFCCLCA